MCLQLWPITTAFNPITLANPLTPANPGPLPLGGYVLEES